MRSDEALEYAKNSVRESVKDGVKREPNTMMCAAKVLSPPVPLANAQIRDFFGDTDPATPSATAMATNNEVTRFQFKARIVNNEPWNAHLRYPDPCNIDTATGDTLESVNETIRETSH